MAGTLASLIVHVGADVSDIKRGVQEGNRSLESLAQQTSKTHGALDKLSSIGDKVNTKMVAMGAAIGTAIGVLAARAVEKLVAGVTELASRGIALAPVVTSFENLTRSIGESADIMLGQARTATRGLVSDLDLMAAANKAILLGLPVTSGSFAELAQSAVVLGRAMKLDAANSVDDLITALGRSSPQILDNLGITVKVGEANKQYAKELSIVGRELTDSERKLAFYNATLEAARVQVEALGGLQLTFADHLLRVRNQMTNVTDALGVAIARSPVVNAAFSSIADAMEQALGGNQVKTVQTLIGWVDKVAIGIVDAAQMGITAAGILHRAWSAIGLVFNATYSIVLAVASAFANLVAGVADVASKAPGVGHAFDGVAQAARAAADKVTSLQHKFHDNAEAALDAVRGQGTFQDTLRGVSGTLTAMRDRMVEASKTQSDAAVIAEDLTSKTSGASEAVTELTKAEQEAAKTQKQWSKATATTSQEMTWLIARLHPIPPAIQSAAASTQVLASRTHDLSMMIHGIDWNPLSQGASQAVEKAKTAFDRLRDAAQSALGDLNNIFQSAFEGGGGIGGGIKSFATSITKSLLSLIPGIGPIVSQFSGAIVAGFSKIGGALFGGGEHAKVNDRRDDFIAKTFGSTQEMFEKAGELGLSEADFRRLFDAKTARDFESAVAQINARMEEHAGKLREATEAQRKAEEAQAAVNEVFDRYKVSWQHFDGEERTRRMGEAVGALESDFATLTDKIGIDATQAVVLMKDEIYNLALAAVEAGEGIPPAMAPWLKQLAEAGHLTEEHAAALLGLKHEADVNYKDMEAAAQRYGIELDKLGPKYEQLKLTDVAGSVLDDWNLMIAGGVPLDVLLEGMGDEVSGLAQKAKKFGLELPADMQPVMQTFLDNGKLVDENGQKLKDLSGINFAEPIESAVRDLITKLDELISKFDDTKTAIDDIPEEKQIDIIGNVQIPEIPEIDFTFPDMPEWMLLPQQLHGLIPERGVIPMAEGGMGTVTRPTLFLAGERGPEQVAFSGAHRRFSDGAVAPGGGETVNLSITINAADRAGVETYVEDRLIPAMAKVLRKGGRNLTDLRGLLG